MEETQLLVFRWGVERYGVPVQLVNGILYNMQAVGMSMSRSTEGALHLQGMPNPLADRSAGFETKDNQRAILLHSNGVQIVLIVDEVIKEIRLIDGDEAEIGATIAPFQLWKLDYRAKQPTGKEHRKS